MSHKKVLGVLAGRDMPGSKLMIYAQDAEVILAADAGADILLELGISPDWVIGDFDSIQSAVDHPNAIHDACQDTTDCDKLLKKAIELGNDRITLACLEGDQLDHVLATLHSAARHPIHVKVALRTGVGFLLVSGDKVQIDTMPGSRVSLLPLAHCEDVTLAGVQWPLTQQSISPLGHTSIGNRAVSHSVEAEIAHGVAFLFVERPDSMGPLW